MTKRTETAREASLKNAGIEFERARSEALRLIETIQTSVLKAGRGVDVNWEHVGDMSRIVIQLSDVQITSV